MRNLTFNCIIAAMVLMMAWSTGAQVPADAIWVDAKAPVGGDGTKDKPYLTINEGLKKLTPGGTVVVKAGIYYESVHVPGGLPGKPSTLMSFPGERVIISGMRRVIGWQDAGNGIYKTTVKKKPQRFYVRLEKQKPAREPDEGWWKGVKVEQNKGSGALICPDNLKGFKKDLNQGEVFIWNQRGNNFFTLPITGLDAGTGKLSINTTNKWLHLKEGDKFFLINHPSLINLPGEWAALPKDDKFEVFFKPGKAADIDEVFIPFETRRVVGVIKQKHVRIIGLDVIGSDARGKGIDVLDSEDVEVKFCRTYLNNSFGINFRNAKNCKARNNLSFYNENTGMVFHTSTKMTVEENEIAWNGIDGLVISWNSSDFDVRRNYIHDHLLWGHPDNMQMYRNVENIRVVDNLLLAGGQTIMIEQAKNLLFQGNMFVGCVANMLIFGHKNTTDCKVINNTLAFPGYSCLSLTSNNYELKNNIMAMGHSGVFFSIKKVKGYKGDNNLYWTGPGIKGGIPSDKGWHRSIADFKKANPDLEANSVFADPLFVNAPSVYQVLDGRNLEKCTRAKLYLRGGVKGFAVGDNIEINFDGVVRKAKDVTGEYIVVDPALDAKPFKPYTVANWKDKADFKIDLSLQAESPAAKLANGKPAGSGINIQAFRKADFNNDGKRDVPRWPTDVSWSPE